MYTAVPTPVYDLIYPNVAVYGTIVGQPTMQIGWNVFKDGSYLVTVCDRGVRCQFWEDTDVQGRIKRSLFGSAICQESVPSG